MELKQLRVGNIVERFLMECVSTRERVLEIRTDGIKVATGECCTSGINLVLITKPLLLDLGFSNFQYKENEIGITHKFGNFILVEPFTISSQQKYFAWRYRCESKASKDMLNYYKQFKYIHELQNFLYDLYEIEI